MISQPPKEVIEAAIEQAKMSPCAKSKRGAAIFEVTEIPQEKGLDLFLDEIVKRARKFFGPTSKVWVTFDSEYDLFDVNVEIPELSYDDEMARISSFCQAWFYLAKDEREDEYGVNLRTSGSREIIENSEGHTFRLVSTGHNSQPAPFACTGTSQCKQACAKLCEHAEAMALRKLKPDYHSSLHMVHIKIVDGEPVASGPPSCWQCSRLILADGRVDGVWLLHEPGWKFYPSEEFHRLTLEQNGIATDGFRTRDPE